MGELMKQKAYRSFVLSFLGVFVLPMLLMLFFMNRTLDIAQSEERIANQLMLEQYKNGVDGQMYAIKRIGDTLIVDDKALLFSSAGRDSDYLRSATVFQAIRSLMQQVSTINVSNDQIGRVYLYFPKSGKVISNTTMDAPVFYQRQLEGGFDSYEAFEAFMASGYDGFARVEADGVAAIYYLRTFERNLTPSITCAISLSSGFFESFRPLFDKKEGVGFTLLSPEGELLFTTLADAAFLQNGVLDGQTVRHGDSQLVVLKSTSQDTLLSFVVTIPENVYTARLKTMQTLFGIVAAGILLAGVGLSLAFARQRYAPIKRLLEIVGSRPQANAPESRDDFTYLTDMVTAMQSETVNINRRLQYTAKRMGHFQLEKLLSGAYKSAAAMEEALLNADVAFASDRFALAVVRLGAVDTADLGGDRALTEFVACNVLEELLAAFSPQSVLTDDLIVLILSLPEEDVSETLAQALRRGAEVLRESFTIHLAVVLSRTAHGLNDIRLSYLEAKAELSAAPQGDFLLFPWQQKAEKSARPDETDALSHQLSRLILLGAAEELDARYAALQKASEGRPAWSARMTLTLLMHECLEGLALRLPQGDMAPLTRLCQHYIESPVGFDEFGAAMPVLKAMAAAAPEPQGRARSDDIGRAAFEYISANYASPDMSLQSVSEHLGLTASYCSQLYKRQTGRGLMDDINRVRLEKAKALLRESRQGIEEIARQVGFLNSSTFIRSFKRYEGITPGQFRQQNTPPLYS